MGGRPRVARVGHRFRRPLPQAGDVVADIMSYGIAIFFPVCGEPFAP